MENKTVMETALDLHSSNLSEQDFERISDIVYKHCGINLHGGKKPLVRARLAKRMRIRKINSFSQYIDYALSEAGEGEFQLMVDALSTNLTSFFREQNHFNYLVKTFLPELTEKKAKHRDLKIRFWSAGCSSGEEPYSLAITLSEELGDKGQWDIRILASDVSTQMLQRAQAGTYDQERVAPLSPQQKQRFLIPNRIEGEKVYQVKRELQNMIRFRYLNLMERWPFRGPFDAIFCRNVMIYFDKNTQEKLVNRYWDCLERGGLLCIGHSESLTGINHKYRYVQPATYMKP